LTYHISWDIGQILLKKSPTPEYPYQQNAINRTIEAIAKGQSKIILVMATGTGKTYTAFNIVWRLWESGIKITTFFMQTSF